MLGRWQAIAQTADIADPHPNEVKDAAKDRRAAVAECFVLMQRRPDGRRTKARPTFRVAGWRPDEGRERDREMINLFQFGFTGGGVTGGFGVLGSLVVLPRISDPSLIIFFSVIKFTSVIHQVAE